MRRANTQRAVGFAPLGRCRALAFVGLLGLWLVPAGCSLNGQPEEPDLSLPGGPTGSGIPPSETPSMADPTTNADGEGGGGTAVGATGGAGGGAPVGAAGSPAGFSGNGGGAGAGGSDSDAGMPDDEDAGPELSNSLDAGG